MKQITFAKKRILGAALAALTVVAGMSTMAFAGEPDVSMQENGKATQAMVYKLEAITANGKDAHDFVPVSGDGEKLGEMTKIELGEGTMAMATVPAEEIKTKVDEKTGTKYYSVDDGKTWVVLEEIEGMEDMGDMEGKDGDDKGVQVALKTVASVPAEAKEDAKKEK